MIEHDIPQGTPKWHGLRAGKPTSSEFKNLVTSQCLPSKGIDKYARILACEKWAGYNIDGFGGNKSTDRGKEMEPLADADYQVKMQVVTTHVGFCTDNLEQYGCSPDGFVGDDGAVEYKCKKAELHTEAVLHYQEYGTIPTEYVAQPQGVMFITKKKWCDLVFFHPELPGLIIRQYPDKDFFRELRRQLKTVIVKRNIIYQQIKEIHNNPFRR